MSVPLVALGVGAVGVWRFERWWTDPWRAYYDAWRTSVDTVLQHPERWTEKTLAVQGTIVRGSVRRDDAWEVRARHPRRLRAAEGDRVEL